MKHLPLLPLVAALIAGGCTSTDEPGPFQANAATSAGHIARASTATSAESIATGATTTTMTIATVHILATHKATPQQRAVAVQRAQRAVAAMPAAKKTALKKKKIRYIAVDTVRDKRTAPRAEKSVIIWDTQAEEIVGNNVYDVEVAPAIGQAGQFETYAAEYVGGS